jgi:hypothetical protein
VLQRQVEELCWNAVSVIPFQLNAMKVPIDPREQITRL